MSDDTAKVHLIVDAFRLLGERVSWADEGERAVFRAAMDALDGWLADYEDEKAGEPGTVASDDGGGGLPHAAQGVPDPPAAPDLDRSAAPAAPPATADAPTADNPYPQADPPAPGDAG